MEITGADFTGVTAVDFGSVPATSFSVQSDSEMSATSPAGSPGIVAIVLVGPAGTSASNRTDKFTYTSALVVAFGDSVSAGEGNAVPPGLSRKSCSASPPAPYCGYAKGEWTDSPDAYPAVLGSQLGWAVDNFSISGACASTGLPNCGDKAKTVLYGELPPAQKLDLHPSLVTLTVGGNDLAFAGCFAGLIGVQISTPCSNTEADLSELQKNVEAVLSQINQMYPAVPITLTEYYDPLPPAYNSTTDANSICSTIALLYAVKQFIQDHDTAGAAKTLATNDIGSGGAQYYDNLFSTAASVENQLNQALAMAAADSEKNGVNVTPVPLNFSGHDFCQDYPGGNGGWIFGPGVPVASAAYGISRRNFSSLRQTHVERSIRDVRALASTRRGSISELVGQSTQSLISMTFPTRQQPDSLRLQIRSRVRCSLNEQRLGIAELARGKDRSWLTTRILNYRSDGLQLQRREAIARLGFH